MVAAGSAKSSLPALRRLACELAESPLSEADAAAMCELVLEATKGRAQRQMVVCGVAFPPGYDKRQLARLRAQSAAAQRRAASRAAAAGAGKA